MFFQPVFDSGHEFVRRAGFSGKFRLLCRVRRVPLIETGTPYEPVPLLIRLDPDAFGRIEWSTDGPLLPICPPKQHFYCAVERHQRCVQPFLA